MSETLTPVFRLEYFITAAANGTPCDLEPIFNEEKYLHAIAGASVDLPMPIGRTQEYLAKLAGMDVEIPDKPIYRTEYYLAHMIDSTVECPAPVFREEMFYYEWASSEYVTIVGNPVTFSAKAAPLKQLSVAFSPVQTGTGDPSPDNVRPISGWDSLNVWQRGVNLFDGEMENGDISETTGQNAGTSSSRYRSKNYIPIPDTTQFPSIYFHTPGRTGTVRLFLYDKDKNFMWITTADCNSVYTFSNAAKSSVKYIRFRFASAKKDGDAQISLNIPTTAHEYVPYGGRSISITIGSTVYSGKLDVLTGVLKVRPYFASYNGETLVGPWMSSMDKYVAGATPTVGAQVVDMGGAETTIQLTPQEVSSLLGDNIMWSDANGNLTVTYAADPATTPIVGKGKVGQAIIGG